MRKEVLDKEGKKIESAAENLEMRLAKSRVCERVEILMGVYKQLECATNGEYRQYLLNHSSNYYNETWNFISKFVDELDKYGLRNHADKIINKFETVYLMQKVDEAKDKGIDLNDLEWNSLHSKQYMEHLK